MPIVVAVNKIDKHDADPEKVRNELSQEGVIAEEWGGENIFVPVSAKTGDGIDKLLESILLQAEVLELKAVQDAPAIGVVLEASVERGRGAVATVLVKRGTLKIGDSVVAGEQFGRVRALFDERGKEIDSAGPSIPAQMLGLSSPPNAGDELLVVDSERKAREVALYRQGKFRDVRLARQAGQKSDDAFAQLGEDAKGTVNLLIKADVQGSAEALREALDQALDRRGVGQGHLERRRRPDRIGRDARRRLQGADHRLQHPRGRRGARGHARPERRSALLQRDLRGDRRHPRGAHRHARARGQGADRRASPRCARCSARASSAPWRAASWWTATCAATTRSACCATTS